MNKLVNIVCAMLLLGPLAMGFALGDGDIKNSNKELYSVRDYTAGHSIPQDYRQQ